MMTNPISLPLVLKFADWPETDKSAWETLFTKGDIFDGEGACFRWSKGTRTLRAQAYGQWLSFLARMDPDTLFLAPADRISQAKVERYIEECKDRLAPQSMANLITGLAVLARLFASDRDWAWLDRAAKRLTQQAQRKGLPRAHPITAGAILKWSLVRMKEVESNGRAAVQQAISFRQALMIGVLISRPVRRKAFLSMRVDKHIIKNSSGFKLAFSIEDMKDKRDRDFSLPDALVPAMETYLAVHRPCLLQEGTSTGLWINQYGDPITEDGFSRELPKITKRFFGIELRSHAFRHIAATSTAETVPEHVGIIRDLLGHATMTMSEKHYNRATGISSCSQLQSIVEDIVENVPIVGRAKRSLTPPKNVSDK